MTTYEYQGPEAHVELTSEGTTFKAPPETFWLAYRGSIAHNMFVPTTDAKGIDDIDLMGFTFGSLENYFGLHEWGSRGTKEIKDGPYDVVLYEVRKAFSLLLQGNPNIMSMLWVAPEYTLTRDPAAQEIIANRKLFLGKHVYNAFAGYAYQQMKKMETRDPAELRQYLAVTAEMKYRGIHPNHKGERFPEPSRDTGELKDAACWDDERLRARLAHYQRKGENLGYMGDKRKQLVLEHGYDSKNAAHLIRLLRMAVEFFQTGEMLVKRPDREELLAIKRGTWSLGEVKELAAILFAKAKAAQESADMPSEPDFAGAEKLLVRLIHERLR